MIPSLRKALLFSCCALIIPACGTTVAAYKIGADGVRRGGVPFFAPRSVVSVKQPVEAGRIEDLYAIVEVGGLERFLYCLTPEGAGGAPSTLAAALEKLTQLLGKPSLPVAAATSMLTERTTKLVTHGEGGKPVTTKTETTKIALIPMGTTEIESSAPFYTASDPSKVMEVMFLPDFSQEWELVISPGWFASNELDISLVDGWRLTTIGASATNVMAEQLGSLVSTAIGAQKDVKVANIAKTQALQLQQLQNDAALTASGGSAAGNLLPHSLFDTDHEKGDKPSSAGGEEQWRPEPRDTAEVRFLGFAKRVRVQVVAPGLYPADDLLAGKSFAIHETEYWQHVSF